MHLPEARDLFLRPCSQIPPPPPRRSLFGGEQRLRSGKAQLGHSLPTEICLTGSLSKERGEIFLFSGTFYIFFLAKLYFVFLGFYLLLLVVLLRVVLLFAVEF